MNEARPPLRSVVVMGSGQVGVIAAIAVKRALPSCNVTIIAHQPRSTDFADYAASALPFTNRLHARLGVREDEILVKAGGSHRLIERLFDWGGKGQHGAVAYGDVSAQGAAAFARQWGGGSRSAAHENPPDSLVEMLANEGRFARPQPSVQSPLHGIEYALRWNAGAYLQVLIQHARDIGISYRDAPLSDVRIGETGAVGSVHLESGQDFAADLYLDCSGGARLLVGRLDGAGDNCLHGDARRIVVARPGQPMLALEDRLTLTPHGWLREFAGRDGLQQTLGLALSSGPDEACRSLGLDPIGDCIVQPGALKNCWSHNVVALGNAAAQCEPLGNYHVDLAHRMIGLLVEMLPGRVIEPTERAEFNRRAKLMIRSVWEITALHHQSPASGGMVPVEKCGTRAAHTIDQFSRRGRLPHYDEQPLSGLEKQGLLRALGFHEGTPPQRRSMAHDTASRMEKRFAAQARAVVAETPFYSQWLSRHLRG